MKLARIIAPLGLSAVAFILSYLLIIYGESGFTWLLFLVIGVVLAGVGSLASLERLTGSTSDKKKEEELNQ
jgi:hypothetical protein